MQNIGKFFERFNNIALKELKKREIICSIIENTLKQNIEIKDISIKNGIIAIKGNQTLKSEIYLKKTLLISLISEKTKEKISDIK